MVQYQASEDMPCIPIPTPEGLVFELNNRVPHKVVNASPEPRIHLVVDVAEVARNYYELPPGTVCPYVDGVIKCPGMEGAAEEGRQYYDHVLDGVQEPATF